MSKLFLTVGQKRNDNQSVCFCNIKDVDHDWLISPISGLYTHFAYIIYKINLSHAKHGVRSFTFSIQTL